MNRREAGGPGEGGGEQSTDAERERACVALPELGLPRVSLHRAGLLAVVPRSKGAKAIPSHLFCLCQAYQLFSGTQIFNYQLLLDFNGESPSCV